MKKKIIWNAVFILLGITFFATSIFSEEGMYPISEIHKLNLQEKGLLISPTDIYNPNGTSLIDGIVKVGGCTGSFVSPNGLILTNHHCAYRAAQAASSAEHDYIQNGFLARNRDEEIPAKGYTVRITESYRDVSDEVLSAVDEDMELAERTKAIEKKIKEIVAKTEKENPGKRAEVSEMFMGKTYVLFIYTYLRDVRLVYVPPRSIGNFGGEVDNWVWPRHTGDFSFMRVYAAPDGSPAEYSQENVPYQPKKFLKVAPQGVQKEDFVFILGYPGRTYRHRTSHFLAYEEDIRMPYVANFYEWQISVMEEMSKRSHDVKIKHLSRIKGLSNVMKNYRGKLKGLKRLNLVEKKREQEKELQNFIESDPQRKARYGNLLNEIGKIYDKMSQYAPEDLVLSYLNRSPYMLSFAYTIYEASIELQKDNLERKSAYMDRNFDRTEERMLLALNDYYEPTDKIILKELLMRAAKLPPGQGIPAVESLIQNQNTETAIDEFIEAAYENSKLNNPDILEQALTKSSEELEKMNDPFIKLAAALYPTYQESEEREREWRGALDKLYAQLIDVKQEFLGTEFIPDANGTLRLTYGNIRGYFPRDAVYYEPITTLDGVIEKTTGTEPFDTPEKLMELYKAKDYGRYKQSEINSVPVDILYNTDTSGGNSGSPILNAKGELVGINFDRAWEATINDFAWSEDYSRSIGVDIRYVLWITQKYGGVDYLLKEMGVKK